MYILFNSKKNRNKFIDLIYLKINLHFILNVHIKSNFNNNLLYFIFNYFSQIISFLFINKYLLSYEILKRKKVFYIASYLVREFIFYVKGNLIRTFHTRNFDSIRTPCKEFELFILLYFSYNQLLQSIISRASRFGACLIRTCLKYGSNQTGSQSNQFE